MGENDIIVGCDKNWILEPVDPWDYSNTKRRKNYLAVVTKTDNGDFSYEWLKESKESDEYFNITNVKVGDVLMAGYKDNYNYKHSEKLYYKVIEKTNDNIVLTQGRTYRSVA